MLEAFNYDPNRTRESQELEALVSIAISLKRIADMMQREYPPREQEPEGGE